MNTTDLVVGVMAAKAMANEEALSVYTTNDNGNLVPAGHVELTTQRDAEGDTHILVIHRRS